MAIVSDIEIRLRADIARLQQDMDRATRAVGGAMTRIGNMVKGGIAAFAAMAAAAGAGMFAGFIKGAIDATDAASDIAQKTGLAVEEIASLQMWFQKGGMEASALDGAMAKLAKNIAAGGEDFARLGIRTKEANGEFRTTSQVLADAAEVFAGMPDGVQKTALAIELFGKSGADMIPMLNEGAEGLKHMQEMADRLGLTFDQKVVDQAGEFNDTMDLLGLAAQGTGRQVAATLLPTLQALAGSFLEFIKNGDGVRKTAAAIGEVFKVLYTAGVAIVTMFNAVGKIIGASMALVVTNVTTSLTALKQGIMGDYAAAWKTITTGGQGAANILRDAYSDVKADLSDAGKAISSAWSTAGNESVSAMAAIVGKGSVVTASAAEAAKDAAKAAKEQTDRYRELLAAADERVAASAREAAGLAPLNEAQRLVAELDRQIALGKVKLNEAQEATLRSRYEEIATNLAAVESQKALVEMQKEAGTLEREMTAARADAIKAAQDEVKNNEDLAATFGMTAAAVARLEVARLKERLAQRSSVGMTLDEIEHLEQLIALKERSAEAVTARESMEEVKEFWDSVDKTAHDTFVSILDGGKGLGQRLKDTLKNTFFDWLYQMTIKKWIINIQANTNGGQGGVMESIAGMFGGSGSGGAGGGGMMGLWNMGKAIYSGFQGGMASSIGGWVTAAGKAFGSSAVSSFGAGMSAAGSGAGAGAAGTSGAASAGMGFAKAIPIIGWIAAGMQLSKGLYAKGWQAENGSMNSLGKFVSSGSKVIDNLGRALGMSAKTANMFSGMSTYVRLFGRKNPEITEQGIRGTAGLGGFTGESYAKILEKGGVFRSDKRYTKTAGLAAEQEMAFDSTIMGMAQSVRAFGEILGAETGRLEGYGKSISVALTDDAAKNEKLIADLFAGIGDELTTRLLPNINEFAKQGETAAQTLERVANNYVAVTTLVEMMGTTSQRAFGAVGVASLKARERLVDMAGGIEALAAQVDFFAANFLTAAQRIAPTQDMLARELAALGYAHLSTADQYRDAVLELARSGALATEEGAKTYAGLLKLGPAFKAVTDYAEEARTQAIEAGRAQADAWLAIVERQVTEQQEMVARAYNATMAQLEQRIEGINDTIRTTGELSTALRGAIGTVDSDAQQAGLRAAAKAQIGAALAIAKASGTLPKAEDLRDALAALGRDASGQFESLVDYQREVARTNNELIQLGTMADEQLGTAELQLRTLREAQAAAKLANELEVARLDGILTTAQAQVAALASANVTLAQIADTLLHLQTTGTGPSTVTTMPAPSLVWEMQRQQAMSSGMPMPSYNAPSATMNAETAMLSTMQRMEARMANVEQNTLRAATASSQFATQFDSVSAGGNALATEVLK